jgi:hypothetical protein
MDLPGSCECREVNEMQGDLVRLALDNHLIAVVDISAAKPEFMCRQTLVHWLGINCERGMLLRKIGTGLLFPPA